MTPVDFTPETQTVGDALRTFYLKENMGEDGGVNDQWVKLSFGSFYIPFPNSDWRRDAVKIHDLHHLLTGYGVNWKGEAEIGAWELASGCGIYSAAWVFDMGIFALGLFLFPSAIFRAFIRGRNSNNFYRRQFAYEQILQMKITEARALLYPTGTANTFSASEVLRFILFWLLSVVVSIIIFVAPVAFLIHLLVD